MSNLDIDSSDFQDLIQDIRPTEISVFDVLHHEDTDGTSMDYYNNFPDTFFEEVYYLLEYATRQNAEPEKLLSMCQELVDNRNEKLVKMVDNESKGVHIECDPSLVDYESCESVGSNISQQQSSNEEGKRDKE